MSELCELKHADLVLQRNDYADISAYFFDRGIAVYIHMSSIFESNVHFDTKENLVEAALADVAEDNFKVESGEIPGYGVCVGCNRLLPVQDLKVAGEYYCANCW
jgi:hypothetical protein